MVRTDLEKYNFILKMIKKEKEKEIGYISKMLNLWVAIGGGHLKKEGHVGM